MVTVNALIIDDWGVDMPDSASTLRVQRDSWDPGHVALICGIANAGGGVLLVDSAGRDYAKGLTRMRKPFEQIPRITRKELGIVCVTEPVLDGAVFCLEVVVPAADPDRPVKYRGACWYYDVAVEENVVVPVEEVAKLRRSPSEQKLATQEQTLDVPAEKSTAGQSTVSQPSAQGGSIFDGLATGDELRNAPFAQRSIAAANNLDLTSTDEFVLRALRANGRATAPRIAELLGVSESTVRRSFKKLRELGLIDRVGSNKAGYWRLLR